MNKTTQSILIVVALSIIAALLKHFFGFAAKAIFAGVIFVSAIAISIIYSIQKASLRRALSAMSQDEIESYEAECRKQGIENAFEAVDEAELSWMGKAIDVILGMTAVFGPPLVYHIVRGLPLSWDSEFTGWHLLCMAGGALMYTAIRRKTMNRFMTNTEPLFGAYADKPRGSN